MVHIKRVELTAFKSFGGKIEIPLLQGFTVISGPNGSGKSNILDGLLFCLGLATSKGMRADRLSDLVNNAQDNHRKTKETIVSVTFDVSENNDHPEWTVTRRLKVSPGGNYTSTYLINDQVCTATELHEQLNRLRIYPEGYNVVLQGDVTRIITMNNKERRIVIDELAGVAEFDRKIEKTKETLEEVREREERCQIIQQELIKQSTRLASDRLKALKYQQLKTDLQQQQQIEKVLLYRLLENKAQSLQNSIKTNQQESIKLSAEINQTREDIGLLNQHLDELNRQVKALGEEEQLAIVAKIATQNAQLQNIYTHLQQLTSQLDNHQERHLHLRQTLTDSQNSLQQVQENQNLLSLTLPSLEQNYQQAQKALQTTRENAHQLSNISNAWIQEQTTLSRKIATLQNLLEPKRTQKAQLAERAQQLQKTLENSRHSLTTIELDLTQKEQTLASLTTKINTIQNQIQNFVLELTQSQQQQTLQQETQTRLLVEQREKQRQLDRLEATQQAQQEAQGTYSTQLICSSDLPGVCGLVAQIGQVEPQYQLALEIAAGARLGQIVVEDESIAAAGIQLLKQKKAGRATFLPLNKINAPRLVDTSSLRHLQGFISSAVELVSFEPRYRNIFLYVFGNTLVFTNLNTARPHLGKYRLVTLEGELLETSGAMTGGSQNNRSSLHFGVAVNRDGEEITNLKKRLIDLEQMLIHSEQKLLKRQQNVTEINENLTETRQEEREQQLHLQQLDKEIKQCKLQLTCLREQINENQQEYNQVEQVLESLENDIPLLETDLKQQQHKLTTLESSQNHSEWHSIQKLIHIQENKLNQQTQEYQQAQNQAKDYQNFKERLEEKITQTEQAIKEVNQTLLDLEENRTNLNIEQNILEEEIKFNQTISQQLNEQLKEKKKQRDDLETELKNSQNNQQQKTWTLEKIQTTLEEEQERIIQLQQEIQTQQEELPDPLPDIVTPDLTLPKVQQNIKQMQKQLESMEPVNMLALEEYEQTQNRLQELTDKLKTILGERTELLLRIENFLSLRMRAFFEAYQAVNENFKEIFAELSEGDGYLQLEDPENPFNGGLTLVAHPKGKAVQRLSSMSGGEKSLTALSFIFALQRYRPSPFYAFDEVDMFLDGANVEKLSKMIQKEAKQAQFLVVSLRKPMIEASLQTIGVTQARGAHTQVVGIKL